MSGKSGLKKMIRGISGKKEKEIYHVNFADKTCIEAERVSLTQDIPAVDMVIEFKPDEDGGTVTICNTDQVWSYTVSEAPQEPGKDQMETEETSRKNFIRNVFQKFQRQFQFHLHTTDVETEIRV